MAKKPKSGGSAQGGQDIMKQIQQLQEQMLKAQEALAEEQVTGSAGGGAVTVISSGDQRIINVKVTPDIIKDGDVDLIEDLILSAVNQALDESRKLAEKKLGPLAGQGLPF
jgi:DNA-binding YbaB/EbfC family protein